MRGQIVEDVSGMSLATCFRRRIFEPLGMADTDLVRSERFRSRLATGYRLGSGGATAVTDYEVVTVGGGGAYSTARDITRYVAALLGGGANEHGSRASSPRSTDRLGGQMAPPSAEGPTLGR